MYRYNFSKLTAELRGRHTPVSARAAGFSGSSYWAFRNLDIEGLRLIVSSGKHKGKVGTLSTILTATSARDSGSRVVLTLDDGSSLEIAVKNVSEIASDGTAIVDQMRDVTGRPMKEGDMILFPENSRTRTYTIAFGHIKSFSDTGNVTATTNYKDGVKLKNTYETILYGPERCILMPFEEDDLLAWVMKDMSPLNY